jgi:hypothetical protein
MACRMRSLIIAFILHAWALPGALFAQQHCAAKLGGSWFISSKSLVSYRESPVITFADWADPIGSVNLDVFSSSGKFEAQVKQGDLSIGDLKRFIISKKPDEFSLTDERTGRIICILRKVPPQAKNVPCQVDVWLDLFMPGAGYFQCDPENSNEPTLQMLRGATFRGMGNGVSLN